jgi:hypothetical protein
MRHLFCVQYTISFFETFKWKICNAPKLLHHAQASVSFIIILNLVFPLVPKYFLGLSKDILRNHCAGVRQIKNLKSKYSEVLKLSAQLSSEHKILRIYNEYWLQILKDFKNNFTILCSWRPNKNTGTAAENRSLNLPTSWQEDWHVCSNVRSKRKTCDVYTASITSIPEVRSCSHDPWTLLSFQFLYTLLFCFYL